MPVKVVVPIIGNKFQYHRKKYTVNHVENGWYRVSLRGNNATVLEDVMIELEVLSSHKTIAGYTYNNKFIPANFDVGRRHAGIEIMTDLFLNHAPTFSSVEAIIWEDKNIYYYRPRYSDLFIHEIKNIYDNSKNTKISNVRGITPELKTLYLFHDIERIKVKELAEKVKKAQELEEFKKTLQGRLMVNFARVGATILNYSISGNRVTIDWKLDATGRNFNSVIEADSLRVIEAGYCMSGRDKDHSVTSMVKLAEVYEEDDLIYKTRNSE